MNVRNSKSQSIVLTVQDIQEALQDNHGDVYRKVIKQVEIEIFNQALIKARGNQSEACRVLGINRATLRSKMKKYGLV